MAVATRRGLAARRRASASPRPSGRPTLVARPLLVTLGLLVAAVGCGAAPARSEPPKGAPASIGSAAAPAPSGGPSSDHATAVAWLAAAPWGARIDKRAVVAVPLADAPAWTHVRFWGVTTLAGWRYGDAHNAVAAVFAFAPKGMPATVDGCAAQFTDWGRTKARAGDLVLGEPRVDEIAWRDGRVKVFVLDADRRSIFGTKRYFAAYAVLPAWRDACLVVGFAVPGAGAMDDAREVRDRWVRDGVAAIEVKADGGARALEERTFD